jgi:hypothetical protein
LKSTVPEESISIQIAVNFLSRSRERPTMKTTKLAKSYRIDDGKHFRLKDFDPADTGHWHSE